MDLNELLRSVKAPEVAQSAAAQRREMAVAQATSKVGNAAAVGALAMLQRAAYHVANEEARPAPRRRQREEGPTNPDDAAAAGSDTKERMGDEASLISYYDDADNENVHDGTRVAAPRAAAVTPAVVGKDGDSSSTPGGVDAATGDTSLLAADSAIVPTTAAEASQRRYFTELAVGLCAPPPSSSAQRVLGGRLAASTLAADLPSRAAIAATVARGLQGPIGALQLRTAEQELTAARAQRAGLRQLTATALWAQDGDANKVAAGTRVERTYAVTCVDGRPVKAVARDVTVDEWDTVDRSQSHGLTAVLCWAVAGRTLPLRYPGVTLNATAPLSVLQAPRDLASALVGAFNGAATADAAARNFVALTAKLVNGGSMTTSGVLPTTHDPALAAPTAPDASTADSTAAAAAADNSFDDLDDILC